VDEITEDRERAGVRMLEGKRDGVANTETHAQAGRPQDSHALSYLHRELCNVK
jgi:hypothetical protein